MGRVDQGNSGRYRIIERIAEGGMAVVDRAEALGPGGFRRELVLKRIRPRYSRDPRFARMFEDEARIVSQLNHPNIVHIYEFGQIDGDYFLAMEYVPGVDLTRLIERLRRGGEPVPLPLAVFVTVEVCRALDYAHRKRSSDGKALDIIHRDVGPANVLISREGGVKLADFGIARAAERKEQTLDGVVKGKVAFMSPEQLRGEPLDGRSDLFAAGVLLYQLLADQHPFATDRDAETIKRALTYQWPPPSSFNPEIPPALDRIVMKATSRDRFERHETAAELAADLEGFLFEARLRASASELSALMKRLYGDEATSQPPPKVSLDGVMASELQRLAGPDDELPQYTALIEPAAAEPGSPKPRRSGTQPMFRLPETPAEPAPSPASAPVPAPVPALDLEPSEGTQPAIPGRWQKPGYSTSAPPEPEDPGSAGHPPSGGSEEPEPKRRLRVRWPLAAAVVLGLALGVGVALTLTRSSPPSPRAPLAAARDGGSDGSTPQRPDTPLNDGSGGPQELDASPPDGGGGSDTVDAALPDGAGGSEQPSARSEEEAEPSRPVPRGWLRVATRPHYAEVFVDGRRRGTTPLLIRVPIGRHRVRLVNAQLGRSEQRWVTVSQRNDRGTPAVVSVEGF